MGDLTTAERVLAEPALQSASITTSADTINYLNTGSGANFSGDQPFPSQTIGVDVDDFVLEATRGDQHPIDGPVELRRQQRRRIRADAGTGWTNAELELPRPARAGGHDQRLQRAGSRALECAACVLRAGRRVGGRAVRRAGKSSEFRRRSVSSGRRHGRRRPERRVASCPTIPATMSWSASGWLTT